MTEERVKRKLSAIFSADAEGYSRLMGEDEVSTIRTLESYRKVMVDLIDQFRGRVVDSPGDNLLAEFGSVVDAVQCAVEIHEVLKAKNEELAEDRRMRFRIGVNLGDVIEEGDRIYGDGVNIAARLESIADPGGICISGSAHEQIKNKLALGYEYIGEHSVKNIAEPLKVYRVPVEPKAVTPKDGKDKKAKPNKWQWAALCAVVALVLLAGAVAIWNFYFRPTHIEPASKERMGFEWPDKPSIAVLPFANMSKDKEQEYIADGLTENIITGLSQIPRIFVIARNSVFAYKDKPVKVQQVAEELAVQYVLEGSVQQIEDRVRINVQLIDALKGHHLWAKRYDRKIKDLFDLQDEITLKIVISISGKLGEGEGALARHRSTKSLEAWSYAIKALPAVGPQKELNKKGKEYLERAVEIDPNYAWAWSRLAMIHYWDARFGFSASREESVKIGLEMARKAIAIDENLPEGHVALALLLYSDKQYDQALAEAKKGASLGPNNSESLARVAQVMFFHGMFEECLALLRTAVRLDPNHGTVHLRFLGGALRYTGQYEGAIAAFKRMIEMRKGTYGEFLPHICLSSLYGELDRIEEARFHAKAALEIKPDASIQWLRISQPFKNPEDMERMIAGMRKSGFPEK